MSVALDIHGCDEPAEIQRIVEIELGEQLRADGATRVDLVCDATRATVRSADTSRIVELDQAIPKARPRLIALAIAELLARSREPERIVEPAERGTPLRLGVLGGGTAFAADTGVLGGGVIRVMHDRSRFGWLADVRVHHGTSDVSRGSVTTDVADAAVAVSMFYNWSRTRVMVASGLRGGVVRFAGEASDAMVREDTLWAPWFGVVGIAGVDLDVGFGVNVSATFELGAVLSSVGGLVDDMREIGIDEGWMGVHLGIGTKL